MWEPDQSAATLPLPPPFVRNPGWVLFHAWLHEKPARDVTISAVTGSSAVEQERKQEVNRGGPQVVLSQSAYPIYRCLVCCGWPERNCVHVTSSE